jgi:uncharacterized protein YydD (DUF2326 family)
MQWIDSWSNESLSIMAKDAFVKSHALKSLDAKDEIIKEMQAIHQSCFYRGATSKHFTELLSMYDRIFERKRASLIEKQTYLQGVLLILNRDLQNLTKRQLTLISFLKLRNSNSWNLPRSRNRRIAR